MMVGLVVKWAFFCRNLGRFPSSARRILRGCAEGRRLIGANLVGGPDLTIDGQMVSVIQWPNSSGCVSECLGNLRIFGFLTFCFL